MKKIFTTTSYLIIAALMLISNQTFGITQFAQPDEDDKLVVKVHAPIIKMITEALELSKIDLAVLESELEEVKAITVSYGEQELDLVFDNEAFGLLGMKEDLESRQLEDWMFEDLLYGEASMEVEDWMLADNYYGEEYESEMIEEWMLTELVESEDDLEMEDWMFSELVQNDPEMKFESWMFDTEYFSQ
jgi:hypothetical protein